MLTPNNFEQIYTSMISGRLPKHRGDVGLSIFYVARDLLETDKMHVLAGLNKEDDHVYYLAAPSASFSSTEIFETPLCVAFPSHPNHKGDGVYYITNGLLTTMVIKDKDKFKIVTNQTPLITEQIANSGLPSYDVSAYPGAIMEPTEKTYARVADRVSVSMIKYSAIALVVAALLSVGTTFFNSFMKAAAETSDDQKIKALNKVANQIEFTSPLNKQVGRLQKISATVVRAGGWIEDYHLENDQESFVVAMPEWVTKDYADQLGAGVVAERDRKESLIYFVKSTPGQQKGAQPVPAAPQAAQASPAQSAPQGK